MAVRKKGNPLALNAAHAPRPATKPRGRQNLVQIEETREALREAYCKYGERKTQRSTKSHAKF
jgi:hypothetical protein